MTSSPDDEPAMGPLLSRIRALDISPYPLWLAFLNCGGQANFLEFDAYLFGALECPLATLRLIGHTVWELEQFGE